jgi:hypothetical protein
MRAFFDELEKIGGQARSSSSVWSSKTVGAPKSKSPTVEAAKAPTVPGKLDTKLVRPASQFGERHQTYSQPSTVTPPSTNPAVGSMARHQPPPSVVFGVR